MITAKRLSASSDYIYNETYRNVPHGLGYVNFNIRPHLGSNDYPRLNDGYLKKASEKIDGNLIALDDNSRILYEDGKMTIVSEGRWKVY